MEKKEKFMSAEDSFDYSDCSVFEIYIKKWYDAEFERLASMGKDTSKFHLFADPDINEGSVWCEDYIMKFNRDEGVIDLVINGEEDSPVWNDVVSNVPAQFASFLSSPDHFLYRISTSTSEKKDFYGFEYVDDKGGFNLFQVDLTGEWIAENFDSLVNSMYNIVNAF